MKHWGECVPLWIAETKLILPSPPPRTLPSINRRKVTTFDAGTPRKTPKTPKNLGRRRIILSDSDSDEETGPLPVPRLNRPQDNDVIVISDSDDNLSSSRRRNINSKGPSTPTPPLPQSELEQQDPWLKDESILEL
jgi:hypothetical protein